MLAAVVAKSIELDRVVLSLDDRDLKSTCTQLGLENVIIPDRRVAAELLSFAEGDEECPE